MPPMIAAQAVARSIHGASTERLPLHEAEHSRVQPVEPHENAEQTSFWQRVKVRIEGAYDRTRNLPYELGARANAAAFAAHEKADLEQAPTVETNSRRTLAVATGVGATAVALTVGAVYARKHGMHWDTDIRRVASPTLAIAFWSKRHGGLVGRLFNRSSSQPQRPAHETVGEHINGGRTEPLIQQEPQTVVKPASQPDGPDDIRQTKQGAAPADFVAPRIDRKSYHADRSNMLVPDRDEVMAREQRERRRRRRRIGAALGVIGVGVLVVLLAEVIDLNGSDKKDSDLYDVNGIKQPDSEPTITGFQDKHGVIVDMDSSRPHIQDQHGKTIDLDPTKRGIQDSFQGETVDWDRDKVGVQAKPEVNSTPTPTATVTPTPSPDATPTPPSQEGGAEAPSGAKVEPSSDRHARHASPVLSLDHHGANIWDREEQYLRRHGYLDGHSTHTQNVIIDTAKDATLRAEGLSEADAHQLPVGYEFRIPRTTLHELAHYR